MNKQKIYIRKGRCFKEVPDYIGMFYDGEHFTTERTDRSYAVCYDQRETTCYLANIKFEPGTFLFNEAVALTGTKIHNHPAYLPTREQVTIAFNHCSILRTGCHVFTWTLEDRFYYSAWGVNWNDGIIYSSNKEYYNRVRLFFEITIEV